MRLKCISRYQTATRIVEIGQILEDLTEAQARHLMNDAPGCWEDADAAAAEDAEAHESEAKALDEAPEDKMVKRSVRK